MPKYTTSIELEILLPKDIDAKISSINKKLNSDIQKIEISLDETKLNSQIEKIKTSLKGLDFGSFEKTQKETQKQLDAIYKKIETIIKETDGFTTRKLTQEFTKSGEVIEKELITIDKVKKAKIESEKIAQTATQKTTKKIQEQKNELEKLINVTNRLDANRKSVSRSDTYKNLQTGIETTVNTRSGQPTSYRVVNPIAKTEQAEEKFLIKQKEFKDRIDKLFENGILPVDTIKKTEDSLNKLDKNSSNLRFLTTDKDIKELERLEKEITNANNKITNFKNKMDSDIQSLRSKYGDSIFNAQKLTGTDKIIKDLNKITAETENWEQKLEKLKQRYTELDRQMDKNKKLTSQRTSEELFRTGYQKKINDLKIRAVLDTSSIDKFENEFNKLNKKIKDALSNNDTKAFDRYKKDVELLEKDYQNILNIEKQQIQVNEGLLELERKRRQEAEKTAKEISNIKNKELNDQYKAQQAEEQRIRRLGDVRLNNINNSAFDGTYTEAREELERYLRTVYGANTEIQRLERSFDSAGREVWRYTTNLETGRNTFNQYRGSIDRTTRSLYEQGQTAERTINRNLGMLEQFRVAISRIPIWMAGMSLFYFPLRNFQQALSDLKEIDTEMTNLRKVSNATTQELQDFYYEANQIGNALGKTTQEIIASTAEFARLGYQLSEAKRLAQEATLYAQVGDIDVETASQNMISAVKGFGIAVDEQGRNIRKIVDLYNEVGNNYAVSSAEIGESLRRSASALYEAGNTIEESVAMITAANAVVRDAPMVGTALKTISMRIRGISEDGEDLSGLIPTLEKDFNRLGLTLKDTNGDFLSTYEIMDSLAKIWKTGQLNEFAKASILEKVAGKRQGKLCCPLYQ